MKPLMRALALGVGPLGVAVGVGVLSQSHPVRQLIPSAQVSPASCTQPPSFKPVYELGEDYVQARGEGFHFGGESMVAADLCSAGILKIIAAGDVAQGEEPELRVSFDSDILATFQFARERAIELRIPKAGRVFLGFFNDYYETDSRVIFLREMKLLGPGCQEFQKSQFEEGQGINLDLTAHTASLAGDLPLTFTPCRAGELQFLTLGRKGNGALPLFQITQGSEVLYRQPAKADWNALQIKIKQQPITLRLLNPYWKTLGDRNLDVKRIEFTPDVPSIQTP